ncbi:hypothetical protein Prudu_017018 [Prunus dulcis]|uniref:Uncharacterized protein n=1 Tax=Prunus dulcis TaxID=3755 RepID=A0A4Y1RMZ1_PRUDU|nr:hypothetical protein Prudu_017018 [Prunus dulcis]
MQGHRSAPDPPPGQSKLPRHPVENIGFGQNTGETLPNFRQKSKGEFKARRVKRSFVPDIRQVSDTHRAWPNFKEEIGSGPITRGGTYDSTHHVLGKTNRLAEPHRGILNNHVARDEPSN